MRLELAPRTHTSKADDAAYEHYRDWCGLMGIEAANKSDYLKVTEKHTPGVLAWAATK